MPSDASRSRIDTPSALTPGTRLGEYELLSLLGVGGFGIVYLAFDHALEREVAIKEYMPASLAGRTETMHVSLRSQSDAESFALGLRSFVNEAKLLARFDHPSLLKVHRFWEANGTAYMAMPVMRGRNVKDIRLEMSGPPDEAWCRRILMPLLGAIEKLHSEGVYHRDIAPDNIQIEPDGSPVLLDFGAARRVLSDKSQALTAILKPAYAPIEQYGEAGAVKQGPWTDIYSLGATLHYMLLGRPPVPATARTVDDEASQLTTANLPGCSETFLRAIDWMLSPRPADRPQSVAELRDVLEARARMPAGRAADAAPASWERTDVLPPRSVGDRVDLQVDEAATQLIGGDSRTPPMPTGATEHVWIEPQNASAAGSGSRPAGQGGAADLDEMTALRPSAAQAPGAAVAKKKSAVVPLLLGVVSAAAVAAAVAFWPGTEQMPAVSAPAVVPVAGQAPASVPASAPTTGAAPVPVAAAASAPDAGAGLMPAAASAAGAAPSLAAAPPMPVPAAASAPAPAGPVAAASAAAPTMPSREAVNVVTVPAAQTPDKVVGGRAPQASREAAPKPSRTEPVPQPAPEARKPRPAPRPPPVAAPAPAPAPEPVAAGPAPECGASGGVRYHVCMERECGRSEFASHPACRTWKKEAR